MKTLFCENEKKLKKINVNSILEINGIDFSKKYPILEITNSYVSYYNVLNQSNVILTKPFKVVIK